MASRRPLLHLDLQGSASLAGFESAVQFYSDFIVFLSWHQVLCWTQKHLPITMHASKTALVAGISGTFLSLQIIRTS